MKANEYISYTDEVEKGSVLFWLEDLEGLVIEDMKNILIKYSYLRRKTILEGYHFVVELKQPDINITMKILFKEVISENVVDRTEILLSDFIRTYNKKNQQQIEGFEGLIHSFSLKQQKKDFALFKIDLGSAADIGLKYIIKQLDNSELLIKKLEIIGS